MRRSIAAFLVAAFFVLLTTQPAQAEPTQLHVRIEGKTETIFEGPVLTDTHKVKGSNDSTWRRCNGVTGVDSSVAPAVVPTSASSDAMRIIGETFGGRWYAQWGDYFIERWGPDAQEVGSFRYWGVLVNNAFPSVGGCQYRLDGGDEVLWVYDAFHDKPRLVLYPADYSGGALPQSATATLNQPFEIEVDAWSSSNEGTPPPSPTRSMSPYPGAEVAPVETDINGFQKADVASSKTVVSDTDGRASITFTEPGWHRIKATDLAGSTEIVVRSNRLDVCVPQPPASGCGTPPADAVVRIPPPPIPDEIEETAKEEPQEGQPAAAGSQGGASAQPLPAADPRQIQLQAPRLDRSGIARGLVKVTWQVLDEGVGIARWIVASKKLARKGERWVSRARGRDRTTAAIRLPAGATHKLRLTVVDVLGRSSSVPIGRVRVPR